MGCRNSRTKLSTWSTGLLCVLALLLVLASIPAGAASCPSINAIGNFKTDNDVSASFSLDANHGIATYLFTSTAATVTDGVPGLITYCVYPNQPPGNPSSAAVDTGANGAVGDNGQAFTTSFGSIQGFFAFTRADGNPSNIGFDGSTRTMGTATWPDAAGCDPTLGPCGTAPAVQTILLHINDPAACDALYGGNPGTCFVLPGGTPPPPPPGCNGNPACKSVVIDEADVNDPLTVPGNTLLHIHYTYVIVNQPTNTFNMIFRPPTPSTKDINTGGGKDYFGCEQKPDPAGTPGAWGDYPNYLGFLPGWDFNFKAGSGSGCPQSRFFLTAKPNTIILTPGQSISFNVDMVTRVNKGGNQEFTSCGLHLLNSGFTVKWFQSNDSLLHSFSTHVTPIYVNVVSGGKLVCSD